MGTREARWVLLATVLGSCSGSARLTVAPVAVDPCGDPCLVGAPAPATAAEPA